MGCWFHKRRLNGSERPRKDLFYQAVRNMLLAACSLARLWSADGFASAFDSEACSTVSELVHPISPLQPLRPADGKPLWV